MLSLFPTLSVLHRVPLSVSFPPLLPVLVILSIALRFLLSGNLVRAFAALLRRDCTRCLRLRAVQFKFSPVTVKAHFAASSFRT